MSLQELLDAIGYKSFMLNHAEAYQQTVFINDYKAEELEFKKLNISFQCQLYSRMQM